MKLFERKQVFANNMLWGVMIISLLCYGCSKDVKAEHSGSAPAVPAVNVVGFKTVRKDFSDVISMVGTLEANESVNIISEINGTIEKINFEEGQYVKKGDILFQIEKKKLQASYDQAMANLKLAETTAQRYENLVINKAVSQQEYEQSVATLESNRAALDLVREQLEDATVTAAFDGFMGERFVSVGQFVAQGTRLSSLFNQDPIKVGFHLPERYLSDVEIDQTIEMKVDAYKEKEYEGEVYFIDPKIDELTRTVLVKAQVDNPSGELREGTFANVNLIISVTKNALAIPERALIIKGDKVFVYVVKEDQTVEMRSIQEGKRLDGMVIVKEGLKEGEVVVTEGYQKIGPGATVNVRLEDMSEKKLYEII
ncbi:MAG: efflux RND transporter periplasmic adaptor subunit [Candidatus Omnitrophica bacterium]|nr:efflux RND transporter periplasmic adaptor subunit [Candidatus Omnitrophota bacterium]